MNTPSDPNNERVYLTTADLGDQFHGSPLSETRYTLPDSVPDKFSQLMMEASIQRLQARSEYFDRLRRGALSGDTRRPST